MTGFFCPLMGRMFVFFDFSLHSSGCRATIRPSEYGCYRGKGKNEEIQVVKLLRLRKRVEITETNH